MGGRREGRLGKRGRNGVGSQKGGSNGSLEIPLVVEGVWKGGIRKNADKEGLGSCHRRLQG